MARAAGDPTTLLYTLAARHAALWGPDAVDEQLAVADEVVHLAESSGDRERGLVGLGWRLNDLLVLGNRMAVDDAVDTCVRWAVELRQPAYSWYATHCQAMLAMLDGRFAEVEDLITKALAFNPQVHDQSASQSWAIQMYALRGEQGRLEELEPVLTAAVELYGAVPAWRGALAWLYAETGHEAECRAEFERLAEDDFRGLPRDGIWLTGSRLRHARLRVPAGCRARRHPPRTATAIRGDQRSHWPRHLLPRVGRAVPRTAGGDSRALGRGRPPLHFGPRDACAPSLAAVVRTRRARAGPHADGARPGRRPRPRARPTHERTGDGASARDEPPVRARAPDQRRTRGVPRLEKRQHSNRCPSVVVRQRRPYHRFLPRPRSGTSTIASGSSEPGGWSRAADQLARTDSPGVGAATPGVVRS